MTHAVEAAWGKSNCTSGWIRVHTKFSNLGLTGAFMWLIDRMNGLPAAPGCHEYSMSNESIRGFVTLKIFIGLYNDFLALLGFPVGQ